MTEKNLPINPAGVMTTWQKIAAGRQIVKETTPYFETMLYSLAFVEQEGLMNATCGNTGMGISDDGVLYVDPEWVAQRSVPEIAGSLQHMVQHTLRNSAERTRKLVGFDPRMLPHDQLTDDQKDALRRANLGADMAIDPDILASDPSHRKLQLPPGAALPKERGLPEGLLQEEYFHMLDDEEQQGGGKKPGKNPAAGKQPPQDGHGHGPGCAHGWCGSGGGMPLPNESNRPEGCGRTPQELDQARRATADAIQAYAAEGRGNVPAGLLIWAKEVTKPPKIPWRQKLQYELRQGIATKAGQIDLKYDGPSRRQAGLGWDEDSPIMPRFRAPHPEVLMSFDTSGSMMINDNQPIEDLLREAQGVCSAVGAKVTFVSIDTALGEVKKCRTVSEFLPYLQGGGGTNFTEFFDMLSKTKPQDRPAVVVFGTDGDAGGIPDAAPDGMKFIWLMTNTRDPPVDWGVVIHIDGDD